MNLECKNCGGKIHFEPSKKGNVCENCGSVFSVEYEFNFIKKPFESSESNLEQINLENNIENFKCKLCGASVLFNKNEVSSVCMYCGAQNMTPFRQNSLMKIDSVIPFSFNKAEALKRFKSSVGNRFFANKKIFRDVSKDDVKGAYINAFVFDLDTSITYRGVFSYTETRRDRDGNTRHVTRYRHVNGVYDNKFNNIMVEANTNLTQPEITQLMPFDYQKAVTFKQDFLNGYVLEYQEDMFKSCALTAEKIIKERVTRTLLNRYGCDRVVELSIDVAYRDKKYNYCLLPVYFVDTIYKGNKYRALMNGQTGKVGKLPKDKLKMFLTISGISAFILAIILAIIFM